MQKGQQQELQHPPKNLHQYHPVAHDTAAYVEDLLIELKGLTEQARLDLLAHLLSLAVEEAKFQRHRSP